VTRDDGGDGDGHETTGGAEATSDEAPGGGAADRSDSAPPDAAEDDPDERRRRVLLYGGLAALAGTGVASGWYATRDAGDPVGAPTGTATPVPTESESETPTEGVPAIVERYAPDLYFGRLEKWFPTDPRDFLDPDADEPQPVDGLRALDEYSAAYTSRTDPPNPTVFYRTVAATDDVDAIQYYFYSAFDQFSANFHWHDWELLQVFLDSETGDPLLLCASAHKDPVPNNEVLEPDLSDGRRPGVLSEVGSHSSASEVNGRVPSFERVDPGGVGSDVTNDFVDVVSSVRVPFAYGLPRDEGARLPFLVPELDGTRLYDHEDLSVDREDFIDESVTVGSWKGLPTPPTDLPLREPGLVLTHPDSSTAADAHYALEPIADLPPVIEGFDGPSLSFNFTVPGYLEDRVAEHVTSVGTPWEEERYVDPLVVVSDADHRRRLEGSVPAGLRNRVVGRVRQLRTGVDGALEMVADGARDVLESAATVSLSAPPTEVVLQLASEDPVTTVSRDGLFGFLHVEPGTHRLVVNGPGYAPVAARFVHEGGTHRAGGNGDLAVVANEDAAWIRGDGRATTGVASVRVVERYAGVVYDGRPTETDRFAVAVHRGGHYEVEVRDDDGRAGRFRVGPGDFGDDDEVVFEEVATGKGTLVSALHESLLDLRDLADRLQERDGAEGRVVRQLSTAVEDAAAAREAIDRGDPATADDRLRDVLGSLEPALDLLEESGQDGYTDASVAALAPRLREAIPRTDEAIATDAT
jgi:hypothetical protein